LGYRDETQEYAAAVLPKQLAWNSTFMVFRKLHQNVGSFDSYLEHIGREFPGGKEALAAKLAGRWRNGAPLGRFQTQREAELFAEQWSRAKSAVLHARNPLERSEAKRRFAELNQLYTAFDYREDPAGGRCPLGAHTRRANPRAALAQDVPQNRRRLLRRSMPYGDSQSSRTDYGDHGLIFIAFNASLSRQFEYVQQAWLHGGNQAGLSDEQDPLTGEGGSFVVQTAPDDPRPPFFCNKLPRFVETRGGDYFFVPSLTALRAIAEGNLDPS
jgi:Dyp-type peroxidase family